MAGPAGDGKGCFRDCVRCAFTGGTRRLPWRWSWELGLPAARPPEAHNRRGRSACSTLARPPNTRPCGRRQQRQGALRGQCDGAALSGLADQDDDALSPVRGDAAGAASPSRRSCRSRQCGCAVRRPRCGLQPRRARSTSTTAIRAIVTKSANDVAVAVGRISRRHGGGLRRT